MVRLTSYSFQGWRIVVGLLIVYFAREAKGHGVPEVMEAVALKGGRIRPAWPWLNL